MLRSFTTATLLLVVLAGGCAQEQPCAGDVSCVEPSERPAAPAPSTAAQALDELLAQHRQVPDAGVVEAETVYADRLSLLGSDLGGCLPATATETASCPKPASLGADLARQVNVEILLDVSGSMADQAPDGRRKIDVAREVLREFTATLPGTANVGLRVYGHLGSGSDADRARSCAASELVVPLQPLDAGFGDVLDRYEPSGWTPLATSLTRAAEDFAGRGETAASNFVYVVSDGVETCGGDPVAAAGDLGSAGVGVEVNVVGFGVDAEAGRALQDAATAGGGSYVDAQDGDALRSAFTETYDWEAWTAYYECLYAKAVGEYASSYTGAQEEYRCLYDTLHGEHDAIYAEAHGTYDRVYADAHAEHDAIEAALDDQRYAAFAQDVRRSARERRETIMEQARAVRDLSVDRSRARRDEIIDAARDQRGDLIDTLRLERETLLEEVRTGRQEAPAPG